MNSIVLSVIFSFFVVSHVHPGVSVASQGAPANKSLNQLVDLSRKKLVSLQSPKVNEQHAISGIKTLKLWVQQAEKNQKYLKERRADAALDKKFTALKQTIFVLHEKLVPHKTLLERLYQRRHLIVGSLATVATGVVIWRTLSKRDKTDPKDDPPGPVVPGTGPDSDSDSEPAPTTPVRSTRPARPQEEVVADINKQIGAFGFTYDSEDEDERVVQLQLAGGATTQTLPLTVLEDVSGVIQNTAEDNELRKEFKREEIVTLPLPVGPEGFNAVLPYLKLAHDLKDKIDSDDPKMWGQVAQQVSNVEQTHDDFLDAVNASNYLALPDPILEGIAKHLAQKFQEEWDQKKAELQRASPVQLRDEQLIDQRVELFEDFLQDKVPVELADLVRKHYFFNSGYLPRTIDYERFSIDVLDYLAYKPPFPKVAQIFYSKRSHGVPRKSYRLTSLKGLDRHYSKEGRAGSRATEHEAVNFLTQRRVERRPPGPFVTFNVANNRLAKLPEWIGGVHTLQYFVVAQNRFKQLPDWVGQLPNLQLLDISSNEFEQLPGFLMDMPRQVVERASGELAPEEEAQLVLRTLKISDNPLELTEHNLRILHKLLQEEVDIETSDDQTELLQRARAFNE